MDKQPLWIAAADNPSGHPAAQLSRAADYFLLQFEAMASGCELLIDLPASEQTLVESLARQAVVETWRIEHKYSRYRTANGFEQLHQQSGQWQTLDDETARLIAFADQAWHISDGLFDITSGVLRQAWRFDGSDRLPSHEQIDALLPLIGWQKLQWQPRQDSADGRVEAARLYLPLGMELDFGGLGKEYAVDRVLGLSLAFLQQQRTENPLDSALLVNFGGDIACSGPRLDGSPWKVAIEAPDRQQQSAALLSLSGGALATSGDSQRFLLKEGVRYSHLLNPKTGWPITDAARSITVAAPTCSQSGLVASLALLQGAGAEALMRQTGLKYWLLQ